MDIEELTKPFTIVFADIVKLKYSLFLEMLSEMNSIAEYFIDDDGNKLNFKIVQGSDKTFLWKLTIRIECFKTKIDCNNDSSGDYARNHSSDNPKQARYLRLNQFVNIYNHIKQQSEVLKTFDPSKTEKSVDTTGSEVSGSCMTQSKLYDAIHSMSSSTQGINNTDEEICCICMESRSNLILSCTHNFCETCIKEWQITNKSCPICRCHAGDNDGFILADRPDYYILQDEMSKSLFQITEKRDKKSKNTPLYVPDD